MARQTSSLTTKKRAEEGFSEATRGGIYFTPRVDIYELEDELTMYADLPGCGSEDIDLRFQNGELILHGRVREHQPDKIFVVQEFEFGDFYRAFTIHESIDASRITAETKNGVLTVHLPKVEAVRPKQIVVQSN